MVSLRHFIRALTLLSFSHLALCQVDIAAVASAGPPPQPTILTNVPSQTVKYDHVAAETAAAAEQSAEAGDSDGELIKKCDS